MNAHSVAIAGASGVVGSRVLDLLLASDDVARILALGRRLLTRHHGKLVSTAVDLRSRAAIAAALPEGFAVAVCTLGTTMRRAGSKEAFRAIDHGAVLAFAEATRARGAEHFLLVSSIGANPSSRNFYQRTKGEAERAVSQLGYRRVTILRPSLIDDEGRRTDYRFGERVTLPLARAAFSILGRQHRYAPIRAETIARALVGLAFDDAGPGIRVIESDQLHRLAG